MENAIKLAVIGGGSSYTPELVDGVIRRVDELPVKHVALVDIPDGQEKQDVVANLVRRMIERAGLDIEVSATLERDRAIRGADFVVTQFRVGGLSARAQDERIPLKYNVIGQETTGPGGFAKALRTVPVALEIAGDVERFAPNAWIINFTNPSGIVTEAITRYTRARCIGLCNVPIGMQRAIAAGLGVSSQTVRVEFIGLNHLSWARRITVNGKDVTSNILAHDTVKAQFERMGPQGARADALLEALGMVPSYYLRYYYFHDVIVEEQKKQVQEGKGTRAEQVMAIEKELFKRYADPNLSEKPPELSQRGGAWYSEAALSVISAIYNDKDEVHVVNVPSRGSVPDLPHDAVVEVNCLINGRGAHPIPTSQWPASVRGLAQHVKAYEQLTVEAAVEGDEQLAYLALLNHPLVPGASTASSLLEDILHVNVQYLTTFHEFFRRNRGPKKDS